MKKRLALFPLLALLLVLVVVGCAPAKKEDSKKMSVTTEAITQISIKEWKTYVSKYGFSVSYPKDWAFERDADAKKSDYITGNQSYRIYTDDFHRRPQDPSGIVIGIEIGSDESQDINKSLSSSDQFEALLKKDNFYANEKGNIIKKLNLDYDGYLVYDKYRQNKPTRAIFYIPDKGSTVGIDIESDGGTEEFLSIVYSIRKNANRQ
ncbi:MAG: PsbP-related protein [Candidatus Margulisiibacteriota bacterium]|jgi:outer membrane lipoprotein-sorting protein